MWIFENGQYAADLVFFYESNSIEKKREFGRTRCKVFIFKTSHAGRDLKIKYFSENLQIPSYYVLQGTISKRKFSI